MENDVNKEAIALMKYLREIDSTMAGQLIGVSRDLVQNKVRLFDYVISELENKGGGVSGAV